VLAVVLHGVLQNRFSFSGLERFVSDIRSFSRSEEQNDATSHL
jgi:hypothetical protein